MWRFNSNQQKWFGWPISRGNQFNISDNSFHNTPPVWSVEGTYRQLNDDGNPRDYYHEQNYNVIHVDNYHQFVEPVHMYTYQHFNRENHSVVNNQVQMNMAQQFNSYEHRLQSLNNQLTALTDNYRHVNEQTMARRHSFTNNAYPMNNEVGFNQHNEFRSCSLVDLNNRSRFNPEGGSNLPRWSDNHFPQRSRSFSNLPFSTTPTPKRNKGKKRKFFHVSTDETEKDYSGKFLKPEAKRKRVECLKRILPTTKKSVSTGKEQTIEIKNLVHNKNKKSEPAKADDVKIVDLTEDESTDIAKVEVQVSDDESSKENKYPLYKAMFPKEFASSAGVLKNSNSYNSVFIHLDSPIGKEITRLFNKTSKSKDFQLDIIAIEKIENPYLLGFYRLKKEEMNVMYGHVDELLLYHGTKKSNINSICCDNLNWSLHSKNHMFGKGVNFTFKATYASHYCDPDEEKEMLLCKVLVGRAVSGNYNMSIPPTTGTTVYDTSMKDDACTIVKYSDNEFYPLYRISVLSGEKIY